MNPYGKALQLTKVELVSFRDDVRVMYPSLDLYCRGTNRGFKNQGGGAYISGSDESSQNSLWFN